MQIPVATYRLQLNRDLGFERARGLVEYLHQLGVGACYTSPLLQATPGSNHGYDVVDHGKINPELGTEAELVTFAAALSRRGMGMILDVVPNHMCVAGSRNRWWSDVLENGPSSPYARFFAIDWQPPKADLRAKVLLPILGDQFGCVLEDRAIQIAYEGDVFVARYYDTRLPIAPRTWHFLLEPALAAREPVDAGLRARAERSPVPRLERAHPPPLRRAAAALPRARRRARRHLQPGRRAGAGGRRVDVPLSLFELQEAAPWPADHGHRAHRARGARERPSPRFRSRRDALRRRRLLLRGAPVPRRAAVQCLGREAVGELPHRLAAAHAPHRAGGAGPGRVRPRERAPDGATADKRACLRRHHRQLHRPARAPLREQQRVLEMLQDAGLELPPELTVAAEFTFSRRFEAAIRGAAGSHDPKAYSPAILIAEEANRRGYSIDHATTGPLFARVLAEAATRALADPTDERVAGVCTLAAMATRLGLASSLERSQELFDEATRHSPPTGLLRDFGAELGLASAPIFLANSSPPDSAKEPHS